MYSKLLNIIVYLALMLLLSAQTDELGLMLAVGYKGLLLAIAVCAIMAVINAVFLAYHIKHECRCD